MTRDTCRSRAGRRRAGRRRRCVSASVRAGAKAAFWSCSATRPAPTSSSQRYDPDHGDALVVVVEAAAGIACDRAVDPGRGDAGRERAGVHGLVDEVPVLADEVGRARLAEPCGGQHDPVEALEVEVGGDDADALAAAVEQRRRDRDRRLARQRRAWRRAGRRCPSCPSGTTSSFAWLRPSWSGTVEATTLPSRSSTRNSCASAVCETTYRSAS